MSVPWYIGACVCFILAGLGDAFAEPGTDGDKGFEQRRQRLLQVAAAEPERNLFTITAKLMTGAEPRVAAAQLDSLTTDRAIGGMFYAYGMMGVYLHTRHLLPDSLQRKIRDAFRTRTMYRGDTENHWVMYYTGMYLAAQTWPGEDGTRWFNGKSSRENFVEAKEWLLHWMEITSTVGQGEFDSPTYMAVFICPMLVLHDFAVDPRMKTRATMMLDLLLADFAAEHLEGSYGGAHSRDYPEDIINPLAAPSTMWSWLYFGKPEFELWSHTRYRPRHRGSWETVLGALSSYRLPPIISRMATDRHTPYVHRERKRVRNIIRFQEEQNPRVDKYTYMTRDYVLGSIQGGILQPIQQHTWDVTFVSDVPNNTLFTLHPYVSGRELAMFFPEEQKFLAGEVDRYHKVYTNPDKWNSSSPYERTFQHRNDLIVLYSIAPGERQAHIDGFFPKNLDERLVDTSGWIFCRKGNTYIGFFPLKPYEWIEEEVNWRWRSASLINGVVVEVASQDEAGSFGDFCAGLRTRKMSCTPTDSSMSVRFVARDGKRMEFSTGKHPLLDGTPVVPSRQLLFDGPWIQAKSGTGIITLTDGTRSRILNFRDVTITDR